MRWIGLKGVEGPSGLNKGEFITITTKLKNGITCSFLYNWSTDGPISYYEKSSDWEVKWNTLEDLKQQLNAN